jgi:Protein of unknown function (DUF1064)
VNKYRAKKTICTHGHTHDSGKEARRCDELHLLERAGQIVGLQVHPQFWFIIDNAQLKFPNGRRAGYKPDFCYIDLHTTGAIKVCEDVKSKATMTEAFALRAALFRHLNPTLELRLT